VRLKTTFGSARERSANAVPASSSRKDGSVSHTSIVSVSLPEEDGAELAHLRGVERRSRPDV
jgi:hypothetical protein